ncbi:DUF2163 domain-containing protein [Brevundimonas staleyi]|uniref:DUF2163 domain-containing protein n=1 Tax=Brevundimonas staleyi TaxID=74326 RepID=A0ABW0FMV8_9CAUL
MRDIPGELAARIESGAATLCHVWIVERVDGERLGFTDHDRDLTIDEVVCRAASGWSQGAAETAERLAAGSLAVRGVLDDERIVEVDVAAGLWDRATVALWRVDWRRPDLKVLLGRGTLSRIRREGEGFTAEIEGPLAALERVVGRTYGRTCDAVLGDARCGVDPGGRGCDKRWETCVGTFANAVNFQGFPDIPGDDFLTAWPATGGRNDGGSRR